MSAPAQSPRVSRHQTHSSPKLPALPNVTTDNCSAKMGVHALASPTERDAAGKWDTVGKPVPDVDFLEQALASDFAKRENKRRLELSFDWSNGPARAWVVVRVGTMGRLCV